MSAMNPRQRNANRLNRVIDRFLDRYGLSQDNPLCEIRESSLGGFGVFVNRDVEVGEVIFRDYPLILGPRCVPDGPRFCVICFSKNNLESCERGCGLPLCSQTCQNASSHIKECKILRQYHLPHHSSENYNQKLFENLTPLMSLLLNEEDKEVVSILLAHDRDNHGHEINTLKEKLGFQFTEDDESFLRFVCCALDANAFEVTAGEDKDKESLRGLYPLASLVNHSCVPNVSHVFNEKQQMVAQAAVFIPKDSELFHSYTRIIWGTVMRLCHLYTTKHFTCKCARCKDPTEFGTFLSSVLCKMCKGIVIPVNPYKSHGKWQCMDCNNVMTGKDAGATLVMIGSILRNTDPGDFSFLFRFLKGKLTSVVPESNYVCLDLKYKIVWILGHKNGYKWNEMTLELLKIKEEVCQDLLELLERLRCGRCKMRGLLLYELFCCKREIINRSILEEHNTALKDNQKFLLEAASILRYDFTAPEEIKQLQWNGLRDLNTTSPS